MALQRVYIEPFGGEFVVGTEVGEQDLEIR